MLYDDPVDFIAGLQIYRDFSNPNVFYYLPPEAPRVAKVAGEAGERGDLALRLVLYRSDPNAALPAGMEDGGGFLNLDVDLAVSDAQLERVEQQLRAKHGDVQLVPVPFTEGTVELVLLGVSRADEGQPFVRRVAGSAVPSLYAGQRAAFSVMLDRHGAALMRQVIAEGGLTMALAIYHLKYAAIGPAYNLAITIDYARVQETMDLRLNAQLGSGSSSTSGGGTGTGTGGSSTSTGGAGAVGGSTSQSKFVAKAGFHMLMEELKESRAIVVEEIDPVPGESGRAASNQDQINEIIGNLMGSTWFKPSMSPSSMISQLGSTTGTSTTGTSTTGTSTTAGTNTTTGTTTTATTTDSRRPAEFQTASTVPAGNAFPSNLGVQPLTPSTSGTLETLVFRGRPTSVTAGGQPVTLTGTNGNEARIDVAAGRAVRVVATWPATGDTTPRLEGDLRRPEATATTTPGTGTGTGTSTGTGTGTDGSRSASSLEFSFEVNFEMIERTEKITARYDLSSRKARLHEIHPQGQLVLDVPDPERYVIEADGAIDFFQTLDLQASTTAAWELDGIDSIQVQVRYCPRGDGEFVRHGEMMITPAKPTDGWKVSVLHEHDDPARPFVYWYDYKVTVHYRQGVALGDQQGAIDSVGAEGADAGGWIRSYSRNLVIHPRDVTPAITVHVMTGVVRYDLLEKAQVTLHYGPYRQNLIMSAQTPEHRLVIRPAPDIADQKLRTEGLLYYKDGAQVPLPPTEWVPQELVVINEARENVLRVRVILADPNHAYARVQVRLRYEHGNRVQEDVLELTTHAQLEEWAVRLEDPQHRAWSYQATLVEKSGAIETTDWVEGKDQLLILGVQAVDVIPVQVTWLVPLPAGSLLAVKVDLAYDDERLAVHWEHSELIRPGHAGSFTWSIAIKDPKVRSYRYRVTEYHATGPKEGQWQTSDSKSLVLLPGA